MSAVALKLQQTLATLDPAEASLLERLVDDALALVQRRPGKTPDTAVDANGWPVGYFEATAGAFANEPFDMPVDTPPEPNMAATEW
ncbi:MAG: hypothetical protein JNJ83_22440 [Verrucomicrobiaceae bacterium]|nr:hypothetical protein [Verrucomicrobiaceae bacterium]